MLKIISGLFLYFNEVQALDRVIVFMSSSSFNTHKRQMRINKINVVSNIIELS